MDCLFPNIYICVRIFKQTNYEKEDYYFVTVRFTMPEHLC